MFFKSLIVTSLCACCVGCSSISNYGNFAVPRVIGHSQATGLEIIGTTKIVSIAGPKPIGSNQYIIEVSCTISRNSTTLSSATYEETLNIKPGNVYCYKAFESGPSCHIGYAISNSVASAKQACMGLKVKL